MKLFNLCKGFEMQIANGRFTGDFWGNFTNHNKNKGAPTVDLVIISDNLFPFSLWIFFLGYKLHDRGVTKKFSYKHGHPRKLYK